MTIVIILHLIEIIKKGYFLVAIFNKANFPESPEKSSLNDPVSPVFLRKLNSEMTKKHFVMFLVLHFYSRFI